MEHESITSEIISAAIKVHRALGPGISGVRLYGEACLKRELILRGLKVESQVALPGHL